MCHIVRKIWQGFTVRRSSISIVERHVRYLSTRLISLQSLKVLEVIINYLSNHIQGLHNELFPRGNAGGVLSEEYVLRIPSVS